MQTALIQHDLIDIDGEVIQTRVTAYANAYKDGWGRKNPVAGHELAMAQVEAEQKHHARAVELMAENSDDELREMIAQWRYERMLSENSTSPKWGLHLSNQVAAERALAIRAAMRPASIAAE